MATIVDSHAGADAATKQGSAKGVVGDPVTSTLTAPNHWLQATRGSALLFMLAHWPRVPEPKR